MNIQILADDIKSSFTNYNKLTIKLAKNLVNAQKYYKNQGVRNDIVQDGTKLNSFEKFLKYTGIARRSAYNWIEHYDSENKKLLTVEEFREKKELSKLIENDKQKKRKITGEKTEDWNSSDEKKWNKNIEESKQRDERIKKQEIKFKEERNESETSKKKQDEDFLNAHKTIDNFLDSQNKHQKQLSKLKISDNSNGIIDLIKMYLENLEDDNRRIESCQNIIKYCKNIAIELQK